MVATFSYDKSIIHFLTIESSAKLPLLGLSCMELD
jgi:hypothetical protein